MHAVMETGGKQYRVTTGDIVQVEKCEGKIGDKIEFRSILLLQDDQGTTLESEKLKSAKIVGEVLEQDRAKKILVFKKKRRKNYRRTQGHRQSFTRLKIVEIVR
ncbi:MAG TPA: 50S ribosomal protein L21 [Candidatus Manganitrophaceae bacterium]|nr:50S ribosomal protein L21 [Candidatus Manganitrophaceae bacterium]